MPSSSDLRRRLLDPLNLVPLAVAVVWGAVALLGRPIGDFGVETDFYGDARYAREWMSGEPSLMNGFRGPFYHLVLGALTALFRDAFLAGKILSFVSAAVGIRLLGALLNRLWGGRAALAGMLFAAASPTFIEYSYRAGTDLLFWALFVGVLVLLFPGGKGRAGVWIGAGLLAGCAYLTRYNGVALIPGALAAALLIHRPLRRGALLSAAFLLGWFVIVSPWAGFVWSEAGSPFWNRNYENVAIEVYTTSPAQAQQGNFMGSVDFHSLLDVVRVDPVRFATAMLGNIPRHLWHDARELVGWPLAVLALAGAAMGWRGWGERRRLAFAVAGAFVFASLLPAFYNPRFMLPLLPWWSAAAAGVALRLPDLLMRRTPEASRADRKRASRKPGGSRSNRGVAYGVLGVFALVAAVSTVHGVIQSQDPLRHGGMPVEYLKLRDVLRSSPLRFDETTPIAARKPHLGYLMGSPVVSIPEGGIEDLRDRGAHYLLVSGVEITTFPSLRPLWVADQGAPSPRGLRRVAIATHSEGGQTRLATLYAVEDPKPHRPPDKLSVPAPAPPPEGFSRLDHLRYQLVEWSVAWNDGPRPGRLLRHMDDSLREDPRVLVLAGDVALDQGKLEEAKARYRSALVKEPRDERAILSLASVTALRQETEEFQQYMRRYLDLKGPSMRNDIDSWMRIGLEYQRDRRHAAALAPFFVALSLDQSRVDVLKRLAYLALELRRRADAEQFTQRALQLAPGDGELRSLLETVREGWER